MERLTGKEKVFDDEEKQKIYDKLKFYEDLEEQDKLLITAYEICVVSECKHCKHIERRIEEAWIRPSLLNQQGFYGTIEEANNALKISDKDTNK